jgi:hypothetical protein
MLVACIMGRFDAAYSKVRIARCGVINAKGLRAQHDIDISRHTLGSMFPYCKITGIPRAHLMVLSVATFIIALEL